MADWDKIYRNYKKGGEAWATLSGDIHPLFKKFIYKTNFKHTYALDIGCGTGKYVNLLINKGLAVDAIDSSPTAIKMAKELLGNKAGKLKVEDMFKLHIPKNKYDLIISVATIQHGIKKDIQNLINKIYSALITGGKTFITIPDFKSLKKWNTFKNNKDWGNGTFVPLSGPEKGLPHSFYTKTEVKKLFTNFSDVKITSDKIGRWVTVATK